MKKISCLIICLIALTSCTKKYNCHCVTSVSFSSGNSGYYTSKTTPMSAGLTEQQAKAICDREASNIDKLYQEVFTNNGSHSSYGNSSKTNCTVE